MNSVNKNKPENITRSLRHREYGCRENYRKNLKILKNVICHGKTSFRKVWEKQSSKHISCEGGEIFFENYRYFYSDMEISGLPHLYYKLPSVPANRKIEDALILHTFQDSLQYNQQECLIAITAHNMLHLYDLKTGSMLQELSLSSKLKFRELGWNVDQETFVLRSVHNKIPTMARQAGLSASIDMLLAVFEVLPLKFVGMIEIDKRIWGRDVMDAMIAGGMLILMYQSGFVKLFNFDDILQKYRIEDVYDIRLNIKVTECPPVLFEVRCSQHNVQLGGFPWHFIITPYGSLGCFMVYSCNRRQVIEGGHLDFDNNSIEIDRAVFHGDESGRILHIGHDTVRVMEIKNGSNNDSAVLQKSFDIIVCDEDLQKKYSNVFSGQSGMTTSGRQIKKKINLDEIYDENYEVTIYNVDYENELDILCISSVIRGIDKPKGYLGLHDNLNGTLLRKISLLEPYSEFCEHRVIMDRDTIVQIIKAGSSKFNCIVYKLFGDIDEVSDNIVKDKANSQTTRRRRGRRR